MRISTMKKNKPKADKSMQRKLNDGSNGTPQSGLKNCNLCYISAGTILPYNLHYVK
ncbi:hypothetical protein [Chitinophaga rupis]|nr:hypothetical protein [Chitinophaga rupis]